MRFHFFSKSCEMSVSFKPSPSITAAPPSFLQPETSASMNSFTVPITSKLFHDTSMIVSDSFKGLISTYISSVTVLVVTGYVHPLSMIVSVLELVPPLCFVHTLYY